MRRSPHTPTSLLAGLAVAALAFAPLTTPGGATDPTTPTPTTPTTSATAATAALGPADNDPELSSAPGEPLTFAPAGITTDRFAVAAEPETVTVTAHDGVELNARLYRPDTSSDPDWRPPVILVHSPYYPAAGGVLGDGERSQDLVEFFTPKGYAVALSDIRGTGQSGGCLDQDGPDQAQDFKTLVEHFAAAEWSNGLVGSYGKSYDAESQNAGAVLRPQGLATMVTVAGISGLYDVYAFDGVPLDLNGLLSAGIYTPTGLYPPDSPARFAQRPGCLAEHVVEAADLSGDMDDYWAEREFRLRVRDVEASVLYVHGLNDGIVTPIALDGWYDELPVFKRAVLGQWAHHYSYDAPAEYRREDWYDTIHAWFDHELLGLDTGIAQWPPVQVQSEDNTWRAVRSFEQMGTERTLAADGDGVLQPADPADPPPLPEPMPISAAETFAFETEPFAGGIHLSGQVFLDATIALDVPDAHFAVTVRETGTNRVLTTGYLSAPHAESLMRQVPPQVGHPVPYRIRTYPFDADVAPGNAVRVEVSSGGGALDLASTGTHWTGQLHRAAVRLPVVEAECGVAVATTQPPRGTVADCAAGLPGGGTYDLPDPRGHEASARFVGSTTGTVEGVPVVREWGYLTVRDGIELAFEVIRPDDDQPHPTLLTYDGYYAGGDPDPGYARRYLPRGYALAGLQVRGTGCSGGEFDFFQPAEGTDGHEMVEWLARQDWSTGRIGLVGKSYPGITQLFTANSQPPSLAAIAPGHVFADVYRDVAYPGGIYNHSFAALWSHVARPAQDWAGAFPEAGSDLFAGEPTCAAHQTHNATGADESPFLQGLQHPYDDALVRDRSPLYEAHRIEVPVFMVTSWQDEQLGSRNTRFLEELERDGTPYRAIVGNGDHGMYRDGAQLRELDRFFEAHVEQLEVLRDGTPRADYLAEAPIEVFWEQSGADPRWRTELDAWTGAAEPLTMRTTVDGRLLFPTEADTSEHGMSTHVHSAAGSQGIGNPSYGSGSLPDDYLWDDVAPPEGTAQVFTSDPFAADAPLLGSASVDLWLTATAPNVDLQVTLTEVRADGSEVYIQNGWLRTANRTQDASRSTPLAPHQEHREHLARELSPTEAQLARVEVFPFGHVIRAGSRVRVWVEAPTSLPQLWAFTLDPTPAAVTLHHGAGLSQVVLPVADVTVPSAFAGQDGQPACGSVKRQPCRTDPRG